MSIGNLLKFSTAVSFIFFLALGFQGNALADSESCVSSCNQKHVQYFTITNYTSDTTVNIHYEKRESGELCGCNLPKALEPGKTVTIGIENDNLCTVFGVTDTHAHLRITNPKNQDQTCWYDVKFNMVSGCGQSVEARPYDQNQLICGGSGASLVVQKP